MKSILPGFLAQTSIRDRLIVLATVCAVVSMAIAGITWSRQKDDLAVVQSLESTTRVVRAAMMTDMMHDAIHAEVVGAALAVTMHDQPALDEAGKKLRINLEVLVDNYAKVRAQATTPLAKAALAKGQSTVDRYRGVALATYEPLRSGAGRDVARRSWHD